MQEKDLSVLRLQVGIRIKIQQNLLTIAKLCKRDKIYIIN